MEDQKRNVEKKSTSTLQIIEGNLNTLWIDSATFKGSDKRIIFRFYAELPDSLTLHGWTNDGDNNPDQPDIKLKISAQVSNIPFGNKTYFGNLVLRKPHRKQINIQITDGNFLYVLFVPHDPADGDFPSVPPGQITYDIYLTNDDPSVGIVQLTLAKTFLGLNPSPPRNP